MKSFKEFQEELSILKPAKPILSRDGKIESVRRMIKKMTSPPKIPSIQRQISTMVGNAKAGQIRRATKPN
jgi:hypothetical protein